MLIYVNHRYELLDIDEIKNKSINEIYSYISNIINIPISKFFIYFDDYILSDTYIKYIDNNSVFSIRK